MSKAFKLVWPLYISKISISFYLPIKSAFNREKFNTNSVYHLFCH